MRSSQQRGRTKIAALLTTLLGVGCCFAQGGSEQIGDFVFNEKVNPVTRKNDSSLVVTDPASGAALIWRCTPEIFTVELKVPENVGKANDYIGVRYYTDVDRPEEWQLWAVGSGGHTAATGFYLGIVVTEYILMGDTIVFETDVAVDKGDPQQYTFSVSRLPQALEKIACG